MLYFTNIDEVFCLKHGLNNNQAALLSLIIQSPLWAEHEKDGWYWLSRSKVAQELPRYFQSERTVTREVAALVDKGIIERKDDGKKNYFRITELAKEWGRSTVAKVGDPSQSWQPPIAKVGDPTVAKVGDQLNKPLLLDKPILGNNKKTKSAIEKIKSDYEILSLVDDQVLSDWLELRKQHKAVNSKTALSRIENTLNELFHIHRIDPNEALAIQIERGWRGLKSDWVINHLSANQPKSNIHTAQVTRTSHVDSGWFEELQESMANGEII